MGATFYVASAVAVFSTIMVVTRAHAVHALLYLVVSFFSVAVVFYVVGAPFVAALEVIIYAGAIVVLFVFAVMILPARAAVLEEERLWFRREVWGGSAFLALLLGLELVYLAAIAPRATAPRAVTAREVGRALFGEYAIGVEIASLVLLAGLVGACHLGAQRRGPPGERGT